MVFRKMSLARLRKAVQWLKKHLVELQRRTKTKGKSESAWARRRAKVVRRRLEEATMVLKAAEHGEGEAVGKLKVPNSPTPPHEHASEAEQVRYEVLKQLAEHSVAEAVPPPQARPKLGPRRKVHKVLEGVARMRAKQVMLAKAARRANRGQQRDVERRLHAERMERQRQRVEQEEQQQQQISRQEAALKLVVARRREKLEFVVAASARRDSVAAARAAVTAMRAAAAAHEQQQRKKFLETQKRRREAKAAKARQKKLVSAVAAAARRDVVMIARAALAAMRTAAHAWELEERRRYVELHKKRRKTKVDKTKQHAEVVWGDYYYGEAAQRERECSESAVSQREAYRGQIPCQGRIART